MKQIFAHNRLRYLAGRALIASRRSKTLRARNNYRNLCKKIIVKRLKDKSLKNCCKLKSMSKRMMELYDIRNRHKINYTPLENWDLILSQIIIKVKRQNKQVGWF